ncbi:ribonuclease activity regulator RraA [Burkholderiales bacterium]|nr:ribonuclease activity regulator RraA [Burkholderiales bacterium]
MSDGQTATKKMRDSVSAASISAQLVKRGFRTRSIANITPINPSANRIYGPAYTLRYIPMREDLATGPKTGQSSNPQRRAIEEAPKGSVLIADTNGLDVSGSFGDILVARLSQRGVSGIVSDGPMRDISEIKQMNFPVFSKGNAAPPSYTSMMAADTQVPIGCGGVATFPGDIIVGDEDGVVVIPQDIAEDVITAAYEQDLLEAYIRARVENGESIVGLYPPSERVLSEYEEFRQEKS